MNGMPLWKMTATAVGLVLSAWILHWGYSAIAEWERTRPPLAYESCAKKTMQGDWVWVDGKMKHIIIDICVRYVIKCRPAGRDYAGPLTCASVVADMRAAQAAEQPEY